MFTPTAGKSTPSIGRQIALEDVHRCPLSWRRGYGTEPMWTRRCAIVVLGITAISGCGGDNGSAEESFCDDFDALQEDLGTLADPASDQLDEIVDQLDDIDPPEQIESAYNDLVDIYRNLVTKDVSLTDPAIAGQPAEAQSNLTNVEEFVVEAGRSAGARRCGRLVRE